MKKSKFENLVKDTEFVCKDMSSGLKESISLNCIIQAQIMIIEKLESRIEELEKFTLSLSQDNNNDGSYQLAFYARENIERAFKSLIQLCKILGIRYEIVHTDIQRNQGFVRIVDIDPMGILEKIIRITKAKKYKLVDIPSKINLVKFMDDGTGKDDESD